MTDLAAALAAHLCDLDGCRPPCLDHQTTAGTVLKWLANAGQERPWTGPAADVDTALVALDGEVKKLHDMAHTARDHGQPLWEHAADRLPLLAAQVYAAAVQAQAVQR